MVHAQQRDAVARERFHFRKSLVPEDDQDDDDSSTTAAAAEDHTPSKSHDREYTLMSVDTIVNGKVCNYFRGKSFLRISPPPPSPPSQDEFPGLIPLIRMYVNSIDIDVDTRCTIMQYLRFISKRASGI